MISALAQMAKFKYSDSAGTAIFKNSFPHDGWVGVSFLFDPDHETSESDFGSFLDSMKRMERNNGNGRDITVEVGVDVPSQGKGIPVIYVRGKNWAEHPTRVSPEEADRIVSNLQKEAVGLKVSDFYYLPIFP